MKPAAFDYHAPTTLEAALALLAEHGDDCKVLAGGQSLVPAMNVRLARPAHLVDINGIEALDGIREEAGELVVGALARHAALETSPLVRERCPLLAAAARHIGHYAIRQRGTIGGSLCHADPAAEWPLVAVLLDAEIDVVGPAGSRSVPAASFIQSIYTTDLEDEELLVQVRLPLPAPGEGWSYRQFSRRAGDFAIVAVGTTIWVTQGRVAALRLALGGVEDRPLRLTALEGAEIGASPGEDWAARVAESAVDAVDPVADPHASGELRRDLIRALVPAALVEALDRASEST